MSTKQPAPRSLAVLLACVGVVACQAPPPTPSLTSDRAAERIPALIAESDKGADADYAALIDALEHDDPAVRLVASRSLLDLTGHGFGYRYHDERLDRLAAVQRWRDWLADRDPLAADPNPLSTTEAPR